MDPRPNKFEKNCIVDVIAGRAGLSGGGLPHAQRAAPVCWMFLDPTSLAHAMKITDIPFGITDWNTVEKTEHKGETGFATWRTRHVGPPGNPIRVRVVEYSPGYLADHWCRKGHILFCMQGRLETTLEDGRMFTLTPGMSYQVADDAEPHRSYTKEGATLFIVD